MSLGSTRARRVFIRCLAVFFCVAPLLAQAQSIVMASTTSTEQSGLFAHLLPEFKKISGLDVKVVAVGTGQALTWRAAVMPMCCLCMTRKLKKK